MRSFLSAAVLFVAAFRGAHAHTSGDASAIGFDPFGVSLLLIFAAAYAIGQWRLARRSRGEHMTRAACFWSGWVALAAALGPPLHALTPVSFAAHMTQHEIMMLVAAPLLVLARPLGTLLWGLPEVFSAVVKARAVRRAAAWVSAPVAACLTHT